MQKHTQGEWEVVNGGRGIFAGDKMVAAVYGDSSDCAPDETMQANARLIASAPELLEALSELIGWVPGPESWHTDAAEKAVAKARAAIAKATGE